MSALDKEKILQKIQSLPDSYWIEHFKKAEEGRQGKVDDLLSELLYLFDNTKEKLISLVTSHYDRMDKRLTKAEVEVVKETVDELQAKLSSFNLSFDKDITKQVNRISTRTMRFDALKVLILAHVNALYALAGEAIYNHMCDATTYFHASTIFEVFKAAGYGTKEISKLTDDDLIDIFASIWRSTDEAFDDVVWRYGRAFVVELQQLVGRSRFMDTTLDDLLILMNKMFTSKLNELGRLVRTDTTFFSTLAEERAFKDLIIDEAVFTAVLDERTSDMCREADGSVVAVEDITPWVNAPPLHYNCRSTMVPVVKQVDWLTGETYEVKGDFDNWYNTWE